LIHAPARGGEEAAARDEAARALGPGAVALLNEQGPALAALGELWRTHVWLWDLEDRARSRRAGDREIAETKRAIDRLNGQRHRQIDALDGQLGCAEPKGRPVRLYSQTVGELCDRLLVVELKAVHLALLADDSTLAASAREDCAAALAAQRRWRAHLQACLVEQLTEQAAGRAAAPPRAELKMYNDRRLNAVTRKEDEADESDEHREPLRGRAPGRDV
jgi:hypothetical protein